MEGKRTASGTLVIKMQWEVLVVRWLRVRGPEGTQGEGSIWDGPEDGEL